MRAVIAAVLISALAGLAGGCVPSELAGIRLISVDPYEGRILDVTTQKAVPAGRLPADQLPLRDAQVNARQTHAFMQTGHVLKVVSLADAQDVARLDHVISARWSPRGDDLLLVLDAAGYGVDVVEVRRASPQLATVKAARIRAPGYRKMAAQGLALSWSADGRLFSIAPREDRMASSAVDPARLGPGDAPSTFVFDAETFDRSAHPGYHSAYFLTAATLIASRGDQLVIVNSEFRELSPVEMDRPGRVVGSDPTRSIFVYEMVRAHASLAFGAREYRLYAHPSLKSVKLPRGGPSLTFLRDGDW
ncbi:MAG: hypothetical protein IPM64_06735 [Phycisphaerales bacterium]|nr:hypothetical protein [Phycisphaerales bacterium]